MSRNLRSLVFCLAASGGLMAADVDAPPPITFGTKEWVNRLWSNSRPRVEISQPAKLNDFASNGKLELSLRQYLELVLANNTQIQIQKLLVQPTRNAITRAFSIFDPVANARFQATRSNTPATNVLQGAANVSNLTQPFSLGVNQTLPTGTQYNVGFNSQKFSTNDTFQLYNPSFNTGLTMGFTQPLLRGRGGYVTKIPILLAKSNLKISEAQTEDQVQRLLVAAENAYWDVIFARENLKVQEQALALSDAALKRAQRELELGALSALEIFQPQAQYARSEILVTQSRYRLAQAEDALRLQAGIDLDPEIRKLPIVLTEPVLPPSDTKPFDREALVSEAIS
ncbi:MAG: TolC family protein, partial [Bryobacter sp.]|nr:TolC family protein [Bryobacter sp.]